MLWIVRLPPLAHRPLPPMGSYTHALIDTNGFSRVGRIALLIFDMS